MNEYEIDLLPDEVMQWARADSRRDPHQLWVRTSKEYRVDEEIPAVENGEDDLNLVTVEGVLELSPQYGPGGWTLQLRAERTIELRPSGDEDEESDNGEDISLDAFESEFIWPEPDAVEVAVLAENEAAWDRFQDWVEIQRELNRG